MEDVEIRLRRLLAEGDVGDALTLLHDAYAADVARYVRFLKATDSAEDLCQEVWLAARRALPRFRFAAHPRTWLFAIAKRRLADDRRDPRRRLRVRLDSSPEALERALLSSPGGPRRPSTPSSALRRKRRAQALQDELDRLDPGDRELVELRFVSGLKPAEIVVVLLPGQSANAVSQRLVRLVRRLRESLLRHEHYEPR